MRNTDIVDDILESINIRRPWEGNQTAVESPQESAQQVQTAQLSIEEMMEWARQTNEELGVTESEGTAAEVPPQNASTQSLTTEQPIIEEVPEIPQEVLDVMDQYITPEPRNLEESVEDVALPEEEEKLYDNIIARDETARFSSAEWFRKAQEFNITLAGLGGVGSWPALLLARLKPTYLSIYDPDRVELVNLAGQLYGVGDIGKYKTAAVADYIINNANYYALTERHYPFTSSDHGDNVMICGFDNMSARATFFAVWKRRLRNANRANTLFIDGRLTATEFQVFCMTGEDTGLMQRYETEFLFADSEASQEICSFKQTAYLANMIAGVIVNLYINFCANLCGSPFKKALPFLTKYNTDMMMFNTEY